MIEVKIPLILEGTWKNVKALSESLVKNIESSAKAIGGGEGNALLKTLDSGFNRLIAKVGILAAIWGAFDTFLRPILSMFKLIMVLILMPMMPLLKQMLNSMKEVADKVRKAQEEAGGTGMTAFTAGIAAMIGEPTMWAAAGALLAVAFVASLGAATLAGVLLLGVSLSVLWKSINDASQSDLESKLLTAGYTGMAAGLAALIFGAGIYAIPAGLLVFGLTLGVSFLAKAMSEDSLKKALLEMAAGSAALGIVAGGIVGLMGAGFGAAAITAVAAGTVIFSVLLGIKFGKDVKASEEATALAGETKKAQEEVGTLQKIWNTFMAVTMAGMAPLNTLLAGLGFMIGSKEKGSYPMVYSLIQAGNEWTAMGKTSRNEINSIISNLNRIPRKIVTTHVIRTVRE